MDLDHSTTLSSTAPHGLIDYFYQDCTRNLIASADDLPDLSTVV